MGNLLVWFRLYVLNNNESNVSCQQSMEKTGEIRSLFIGFGVFAESLQGFLLLPFLQFDYPFYKTMMLA